MGANMFDSPIAGQYMNTYARLPFQEIATMGNQLRKRSDDTLNMISANEDLMNLPVLDADVETRKKDQEQFKTELEEVAKLHASGEYDEAQRRAKRLGSGLKTWKEQDRGYNMAEAYAQYNENAKMFDSAVAKGLMTAEQGAWEKQQALSKYGGVDKGRYQSTLPTVISNNFTNQANDYIKGWAADKGYNISQTSDGSYIVLNGTEKVDPAEVQTALDRGLRTPENLAWATRQAEFQMRTLDPNQNEFDIDGKKVTRNELKQQLINEEFNKATSFAAAKAGYTKEDATLTKNWLLEYGLKANQAAQEAANVIDSFTPSGEGFVTVSAKNVDELHKSVTNLKGAIKTQNKALDEFKKANPNASVDRNNPNYDPVYAELVKNQELNALQLAEHESYLQKPKAEADKLLSSNVGVFQFLDKQNPQNDPIYKLKVTERDGGMQFHKNPIYGLSEAISLTQKEGTGSKELNEAMAEIKSGKPAYKLNRLIQQGIKDGLSFEELAKDLGLRDDIHVYLNRTAQGPDFVMNYSKAKSKYSDAIAESMKEDTEKVDSYRMISAIEDGKFGSASAKLQEEVGKDIIANGGQGYSVPTGGQLDQYMKDEFGEGWMEDYADWTKNGKVKVLQTSGYTASGKGILNLSITDDDGKLHNIPITAKDNDMYIRTGREMARSQMPTTRQLGQDMIMNAATVGSNTLGSIVKGAAMESMFTEDNKPRQGVKSPLYGFKENGLQLYITPKEVAGNGMKIYKIVNADGKVIEDNIGGSNDLKNRLYDKLYEANSDNQQWMNLYGVGK